MKDQREWCHAPHLHADGAVLERTLQNRESWHHGGPEVQSRLALSHEYALDAESPSEYSYRCTIQQVLHVNRRGADAVRQLFSKGGHLGDLDELRKPLVKM